VLIGAATGTLKVTSTEADGRFSFSGIPQIEYTVGASKLAVHRRYRRREASRAVRHAGVTLPEQRDQRRLRLPPARPFPASSQRLGTAALGTFVGLRTWQYARRRACDGQRASADDRTDERGRYRIAGCAGDYIVRRCLPARPCQ
jgi:hypothetical protein